MGALASPRGDPWFRVQGKPRDESKARPVTAEQRAAQHGRMTESPDVHLALEPSELESLLDEIRLYLEAIEIFRHEGHEPRWCLEGLHTEVLR
jgi:hypothetical protein